MQRGTTDGVEAMTSGDHERVDPERAALVISAATEGLYD
jgi:hypothetical protein